MYNSWTVDLSDSVKALEGIKKDVLPKLIGGKIHNIEGSNNEVLVTIDIKSGIDYIREDQHGLQGIAARVQWGKSWDTFTIRMERHTGTETELEKRLKQIQNGYFYPAFTLQAYFDNRQDNNLLSIAVIKTKDLYFLYETRPYLFDERVSDNKFCFVSWTDIEPYIKSYHTTIA